MKSLVEGAICRITIDEIDLGYRVDAGDLEDFLSCSFGNRKIEIERTGSWVRTLPANDYWKQQRRKDEHHSSKGPVS